MTRGLARGGLAHATTVGAEVVQVFVQNPRGWACTPGDPAQDRLFRKFCERDQIPSFVHAPYLINFGSPTPATLEASAISVRHALLRARAIGARGVVIHTGSAVAGTRHEAALAQVRECLLPLIEALDDPGDDAPDLLLEPTAGQGESLCAMVDQLGPYLAALDHHPRVGVCLDTCHAYAAGHDLASPGGATATIDTLVRVAGAGRLRLIHANDSKDPCGSCRDRHEKIGRGHIGTAGFAELLAHPAVRGVPVVIETPGDLDADTEAIELLKTLRPTPSR